MNGITRGGENILKAIAVDRWETFVSKREKWWAAEGRDGCELVLGAGPALLVLNLCGDGPRQKATRQSIGPTS